ncbi:MAG: hypothetical protein Q8P18_26670 [Pseudomonadota bacterium]|nr:hypothetical protein [Pseudomonadota bacterium]
MRPGKVVTTIAGLALLTLGACGKSEEAVKPMAEKAEQAAREVQIERRLAVDALRDEARDLRARPDPQNRTLVRALNHTAEALRTLAGDDANVRARIDNIDTYAGNIERTQVLSKDISGWARSALIESALTLSSIAQARGRDDLTPWVRAVQARAEAVNPDLPLKDQGDMLGAAFEDLADSITFLSKEPKSEQVGQTSRR